MSRRELTRVIRISYLDRTHTRFFWIFLVVMLLSVNGCRTGSGSHDDAAVRLINAVPAMDDLSVSVDGQRVWKHSQFRSNTGFQGVSAGTYKVEITASEAGQYQTGHNYLQCQKGRQYTVIALSPQAGTGLPPGLRLFSDTRDMSIPNNKAQLRLINGSEGLGNIDALFNNIVGLGNVAYGSRSEPLFLTPGTYDVKINATDEVPTLVGPTSLHFGGGRSYTLVVMGRRGDTNGPESLTLEAYPDDH